MNTEIGKTGEVTVEGHVIGRLDGFTFAPDAAEAGSDAKDVEERAVSAEEYRALFPPPPRPPDDPPVTFSRLAAVLLEAGISKERVDAAIDSARLIQGKG